MNLGETLSGSVIWRWFGFKVSDEQQNHIICRECNKQVTARGGPGCAPYRALISKKGTPVVIQYLCLHFII